MVEAQMVVLESVGMKLNMDKDFEKFVKNRLLGISLSQGNRINVNILGSAISLSKRQNHGG